MIKKISQKYFDKTKTNKKKSILKIYFRLIYTFFIEAITKSLLSMKKVFFCWSCLYFDI